RDGMPAHDGMAIDTIILATKTREQVAERRVALEFRRADQEWRGRLAEERRPQIQRLADAARGGTGIECRADLVVADLSFLLDHPLEDRREIGVHPAGRLAAAGARDANGLPIGETRFLPGRRNACEEHGRYTAQF